MHQFKNAPYSGCFYCALIENNLMMLVRHSGVKKHIPKGMLAKRDSQEKMWGLSSVHNKASAIYTAKSSI